MKIKAIVATFAVIALVVGAAMPLRYYEYILDQTWADVQPPLYITPIRVILLTAALVVTYTTSTWAARNRQRPLRATADELKHSNLVPLPHCDVAKQLASRYQDVAPTTDPGELDKFISDLLDQQARSAVRESVEIDRWSLSRTVRIECHPRQTFIVLTRPRKGETYRAFKPGSEDFSVLPFVKTQALCLAALVGCWKQTGRPITRRLVYDFARMVTEGYANPDESFNLAVSYLGPEEGRNAKEVRFARLLSMLSQVRPIVAQRTGAGHSTVSFSYSQSIGETRLKDYPACLTLWPTLQEWVARRLGIRRSTFRIATDRGRLNGRFQLDVQAPSGMYIQDAAGRATPNRHSSASGRWFPNMNRELHYSTFSSVEIAPDRVHCRWNITNGYPLKLDSLQLVIRLAETPWGSRGIAAALALLVALEVWMVATSIEVGQKTRDSGINAPEWVQFMLAAPAMLLAFYSLHRRAAGFISGSALVSMAMSAAISIASTVLYVSAGRGQTCTTMMPIWICGSDSVFFISDPIWLLVTLASIAACLCSVASAVSANARYRSLLERSPAGSHRES